MNIYYEVEHYGKVKTFDNEEKAINFAKALERIGYDAQVRMIKVITAIVYPRA